jgi:hemerythrin-like domain-containing protein
MVDMDGSRRQFLVATGAGAGLLVAGAAPAAAAKPKPRPEPEDVSPNEDLMREHGLLDRLLLVYEEGLRRLEARAELPPDVLPGVAGIVRRFIEDYHERLEEEHLFPRFEKAGVELELVKTLRAQHQAGRVLTDGIAKLAAGALKDDGARHQIADAIARFIRMYRPHAAREDTVLFPAVHRVMSKREYDAMGDLFEDREHKLFGQDGFEGMVVEVARLEKSVGIDDLAKFTP